MEEVGKVGGGGGEEFHNKSKINQCYLIIHGGSFPKRTPPKTWRLLLGVVNI